MDPPSWRFAQIKTAMFGESAGSSRSLDFPPEDLAENTSIRAAAETVETIDKAVLLTALRSFQHNASSADWAQLGTSGLVLRDKIKVVYSAAVEQAANSELDQLVAAIENARRSGRMANALTATRHALDLYPYSSRLWAVRSLICTELGNKYQAVHYSMRTVAALSLFEPSSITALAETLADAGMAADEQVLREWANIVEQARTQIK